MTIEIQLQTRLIKRTFPNKWNDLTVDQTAHVLAVFYAAHPIFSDPQSILYFKKVQIFKALAKVTDKDLSEWRKQTIETYTLDAQSAEVADLIWLTDFGKMLDTATADFVGEKEKPENETEKTDGEPSYVLLPRLTKNPLPWLKMPDAKGTIQKYYAAHSTDDLPLKNVSVYELSRIFTQYDTYQAAETSEERRAALDTLIAILYRPAKADSKRNRETNYDGDIRMPLNEYEHRLASKIPLFSKHINEKVKFLIAFHIESCRAALPNLYPDLFKKRSEGDTTEGGDWIDFILEMADFDIVKKPVVMRENAHEALTLASRLIEKKRKTPTQTEAD